MVIGENFIWAHFGKTGGNSTAAMFSLFPDLVESVDEKSDPKKHLSFKQKKDIGFNLEGKIKLLNIRRLPDWLLSFKAHRENYDNLLHSKDDLLSGRLKMENGLRTPDWMLKNYTLSKIDCWFRMEHLADDFLKFIKTQTIVSANLENEVRKVFLNKNPHRKNAASDYFTKTEIQEIYTNSPMWAEIEEREYGSLLI